MSCVCFFFNDTATTEIYTLSLHDALPIFTAYMTVAASALSRPVLAVFVLLTITYLVLAIASFASPAGLTVLGGYLGILTALAAWYASAKGIYAATLVAKR